MMKDMARHWRRAMLLGVSLIVLLVVGLASGTRAAQAQSQSRVKRISDPLAKGTLGTGTAKKTQPLHQARNAPHMVTVPGKKSLTMPTAVGTNAVTPATAACPTTTLNLRVLVLAADGNEADLPAITQELDYLGTPYTVYVASQTPGGLTPAFLGTGCQGNYQGVILTDGQLVYFDGTNWTSALSQQEWTTLWTYEANLGVRSLSWYTFPTADYGFQAVTGAVDTTTSTISAKLTTQGKTTFAYLNGAATVPIKNAYTYLAKPLADGLTTPLISDASGNALALVHSSADGRQTLAVSFDSNPYLLHDIIYSYGFVNWLTSGLFLGERHVAMSAQVDDLFIDNDIWTPTTPCGTNVEQTGAIYRITGSDLQQVINWQNRKKLVSNTSALKLAIAFNGWGTTADAEYANDTLTPKARNNQGQFYWINHTFTHADLDAISAADATSELNSNTQVARRLGLSSYSTKNMVTPGISGLTNPVFLQTAYQLGIRYLVSDTSKTGYSNPSPNAGIANPLQPGILEIPRRPTNLFYNVSKPAEWLAEYNCMYASYWGHNVTYQELLGIESDTLLTYLLHGDLDPWMFHQSNFRAYDGTHSLLSDLLDMTLQKYGQYFNLKVQFPSFDSLGQTFTQRMQYNASGVSATLSGKTLTLTAQHAATIPVTGARTLGAESYGGQYITHVALNAGQSITLTLP